MDISGEHHLDVLHSVYKTRLAEDGQPIQEDTEQYELGASKEDEEGVVDKPEDKVIAKDVKADEKAGKCGRYVCMYVCCGEGGVSRVVS